MSADRAARPPRMKQVNFRLPWGLWQELSATAAVLGQTQAEITAHALQAYFATLTGGTARAIQESIAQRQKRQPR